MAEESKKPDLTDTGIQEWAETAEARADLLEARVDRLESVVAQLINERIANHPKGKPTFTFSDEVPVSNKKDEGLGDE